METQRPGMIKEERFNRIKGELGKHGTVNGDELATSLGVSRVTVRRDLDAMEALGILKRTYGGATIVDDAEELPFRSKLGVFAPEKRAIGVATAAMIPDGAVIGCTGGTTVMNVVKALKGRRLTIVTNAINIAMELAPSESIQVIVTGGTLRPRSYELVGHIADRTLEAFHLDIALLGVDGVSIERGISTYTVAEAHEAELYMRQAEECWVVADHGKIGKTAPALIAPLGRIHRLITDSGIELEQRRALEALGIRIMEAEN